MIKIPNLSISTSPVVFKAPTRKTKKDPQLIKAREDKRKVRLEKALKKMGKKKRVPKPVLELRASQQLLRELEIRKRDVVITEETEDVNNIEEDYSNDPVIRLSRGLDRKAVKESKSKSSKFVPTLLNLSTWYYNQYSKKKPPLIIVLEDFEGFSSQILQDLIANIYEYHTDLPFILVFGIATTVEAVHRYVEK